MNKLLLFDLDGTLLRSDKTISERTLSALRQCRQLGCIIGISTSRSQANCLSFLGRISPDLLITSGGALIRINNEYAYSAAFSAERTREIIREARLIAGEDCEITVDTTDDHYWNYKIKPGIVDSSWGDSIRTDFSSFNMPALKICVEIPNEAKARELAVRLDDCDSVRFSDGFWYKFTKRGITKESSIRIACSKLGIDLCDVIAFGDDYADIGMLQMAGTGVAMGNAIEKVKAAANVVIGSNDQDGIADYLTDLMNRTSAGE